MFVYVPVLRPKGFSHVKTAARLTAPDPWKPDPSQPGRLTHFTVDVYAPTMTNNQKISATTQEWRWFVGFYRALNYDSQPGNQRRFLPDSLVELWLTGQVPTENLPSLLHAIEPTLRGSDARPLLRDRRFKVFVVAETVLCAVLETCVIVGVIAAPAPPLIAIAIVLGTTVLLAFFLDQFCYSKMRRRRRQMLWLLDYQAESAPPPMTAAQIQGQALNQIPPLEPLINNAFDDARVLPGDRQPQLPRQSQTQTTSQSGQPVDAAPLTDFESIFGPKLAAPPPLNTSPAPPIPPWNIPQDYIYDTTLSVPGGLEPRMESILQQEIPELRWEDEAENWGKIRILGRAPFPDPKPRVTVSISRKEPPGPFNLRVVVWGAIRPAADAFQKAITQRIELALYPSAKGILKVTSTPTKFDSQFRPPFFSRQSLLQVPESLEPGMAIRIEAAIPELHWLNHAPDWEQTRIIATSKNPNPRTFVSILRGDPPGPFRLWAHTTAITEAVAEQILTSLLDRIRAASGAIPPDVIFESEFSIFKNRLLVRTLEAFIPELNWRFHAESGDRILISGATPHPTPRVLVAITHQLPPSSFFGSFQIKVVLRGCFEADAEIFHQALLQRLHALLNPATYGHAQAAPPTTTQSAEIAYSEPFLPPFFSLNATVSVAEEFETDTMAAFVARLQDQIPELEWTGIPEGLAQLAGMDIQPGSEIRIDARCIGSPGILPAPDTTQNYSIFLFRRHPHSPFDVWIHNTAATRLDAERALNLLHLRLLLTLRSRYTGPWVPLPGAPMSRVLPTDYPPIFHLNFRLEAPAPGLPLDMESRLNAYTPGEPWKAVVHNGERKGVYLKTDNLHGFRLIYILAQPEPDRLRVLIDTTAQSREKLDIFHQSFIREIQKALLSPIRIT